MTSSVQKPGYVIHHHMYTGGDDVNHTKSQKRNQTDQTPRRQRTKENMRHRNNQYAKQQLAQQSNIESNQ